MTFGGNGVTIMDRQLLELLAAAVLKQGIILQDASRNCGDNTFILTLMRRGEDVKLPLSETALYTILNVPRVEKIAEDLSSYFVVRGHSIP
jgi:hypothetical protein